MRRFSRCFNPCCPGSLPPTRRPGTTHPGAAEFQSLFSWISPSAAIPQIITHREEKGFNPCCPGSLPPTTQDHRVQVPVAIVSILVVLDLSLRRPPPGRSRP